MDIFWILATIILAPLFYMLPYLCARGKKHKRAELIGVLNFFLGWFIPLWIFLLAYALAD